MKFRRGTITPLGSALNDPTLKILKFIEHIYSESTSVTPSDKSLLSQQHASQKRLVQPRHSTFFTQVPVKFLAQIFCLICTGPKHFQWLVRCAHSVKGTHEIVASKPFEIYVPYFSVIEKELPKVTVTRYSKRGLRILSAIAVIIAAATGEFLNQKANRTMAAKIRHLRYKATDLNFASPNETISCSKPTYQLLL